MGEGMTHEEMLRGRRYLERCGEKINMAASFGLDASAERMAKAKLKHIREKNALSEQLLDLEAYDLGTRGYLLWQLATHWAELRIMNSLARAAAEKMVEDMMKKAKGGNDA